MVNITVNGVAWSVPSSSADVNWAAARLAFDQALAAAINTRAPSWQTPAFQNSWANKGAGFQSVRFYVDEWGEVKLEGAMAGGAQSTVAFTLPAGYRPAANRVFVVVDSAAWTTIQINTDGTVNVGVNNGGNVTTVTFLDGITFNIN